MKKLLVVFVIVLFAGSMMTSCSSYTCPAYSENSENPEKKDKYAQVDDFDVSLPMSTVSS